MAMNKRTRERDPSNPAGAALWTPWGLERRPERDAQKLALRKLLKRLAALDRRRKLRPAE
jgi:hypothetical protein